VALGIHNEVIAGEAAYPHQFRPLVPWFCELAHRAGVPVRLAYFTQRLACLFLTVLILHVYLRRFVREELCFAGGVILLAVTPFAVIGQGFQPTDPLNLLLFVTAYWLLAERKDGWLYLLVAVGMLNRETIGLVALLRRRTARRVAERGELAVGRRAGAARGWSSTSPCMWATGRARASRS